MKIRKVGHWRLNPVVFHLKQKTLKHSIPEFGYLLIPIHFRYPALELCLNIIIIIVYFKWGCNKSIICTYACMSQKATLGKRKSYDTQTYMTCLRWNSFKRCVAWDLWFLLFKMEIRVLEMLLKNTEPWTEPEEPAACRRTHRFQSPWSCRLQVDGDREVVLSVWVCRVSWSEQDIAPLVPAAIMYQVSLGALTPPPWS